MEKTFKIGYLPLSKVNWTNETLEAAAGHRHHNREVKRKSEE